ncbi:SDR family NAD(P)-dependent oxidoreductase [Yunchengibacter salinarum]|uniref:SDR family NAD(P)-dependent oxidoreductase n=1 Tax=Yunchengibacter salinarum TaxID=3133399 RepID=UPI0035B66A1F
MPLFNETDPIRAVVVGASGGIGQAVTGRLLSHAGVAHVDAVARNPRPVRHSRMSVHQADMLDGDALARVADAIARAGPVHLVMITTGILHGDRFGPEKSMRQIEAETMAHLFRVNSIGPAMVARHFLPLMARDRPGVFAALSARVGSISDNRIGGWVSYRASKAALNQILKTLSIEQARRNSQTVVMGLHPGTVDTALSDPFQAHVPQSQLFSPDHAARCLLDVVNAATPEQTGRVYDWAGAEVPP